MKKKKRDQPRFKLINEYESQFKRDFSNSLGKAIFEIVKKIKGNG